MIDAFGGFLGLLETVLDPNPTLGVSTKLLHTRNGGKACLASTIRDPHACGCLCSCLSQDPPFLHMELAMRAAPLGTKNL